MSGRVKITFETLDARSGERLIILCTDDEARWHMDFFYRARVYGAEGPNPPYAGEAHPWFRGPLEGAVEQTSDAGGAETLTLRTSQYDEVAKALEGD